MVVALKGISDKSKSPLGLLRRDLSLDPETIERAQITFKL